VGIGKFWDFLEHFGTSWENLTGEFESQVGGGSSSKDVVSHSSGTSPGQKKEDSDLAILAVSVEYAQNCPSKSPTSLLGPLNVTIGDIAIFVSYSQMRPHEHNIFFPAGVQPYDQTEWATCPTMASIDHAVHQWKACNKKAHFLYYSGHGSGFVAPHNYSLTISSCDDRNSLVTPEFFPSGSQIIIWDACLTPQSDTLLGNLKQFVKSMFKAPFMIACASRGSAVDDRSLAHLILVVGRDPIPVNLFLKSLVCAFNTGTQTQQAFYVGQVDGNLVY